MAPIREDHAFHSGSDVCAAWVYRPDDHDGSAAHPVVVMAHGLGAVREMHLDPYARRFAAEGWIAVVFDYRHFGASTGEPRQLISVRDQLADWDAAIAFARVLPGADPDRVAAWGTSFGGGHVIWAASRHPELACAVAQCPFTDGISSSLALGVRSTLAVAPRALADEFAALTGRRPVRVPITNRPGRAGLMTAPDAEAGYRALIPTGTDVDLTVAARVGTRIWRYRPGRAAGRVRVPLLVCVADRDSVAPARRTLRHLAKAPFADVKRYPYGHFDLYTAGFDEVVADQIAFLHKHLGRSS